MVICNKASTCDYDKCGHEKPHSYDKRLCEIVCKKDPTAKCVLLETIYILAPTDFPTNQITIQADSEIEAYKEALKILGWEITKEENKW